MIFSAQFINLSNDLRLQTHYNIRLSRHVVKVNLILFVAGTFGCNQLASS